MHLSENLYTKTVLKHPNITLIIILLLAAWIGSFASGFQFDASAESLLLKNDEDLKFYRAIKEKYGSDDYLVLTYSTKKELFSKSVLKDLKQLNAQLKQVENVVSITSLLDVPLIKSPPLTYEELSKQKRSIEQGNVDLSLAKQELLISPIYRGLLLSKDGKSTALLIDLSIKEKSNLIQEKDTLSKKSLTRTLTPKEQNRFDELNKEIDTLRAKEIIQQRESIEKIREIMVQHSKQATLFLGGVPMITTDSINFIQHDFYIFGFLIILCIIFLLFFIFREIRWVILPLITCLLAGVFMLGLLGIIKWPITVVSSNFPPLLLIITLALLIHLIVSFREFQLENKNKSEFDLIRLTIKAKFSPCFYTAATTIVAFGSLLVSGIQPLIDFGLIMSIGVIISFILVFTFFPASLLFFQAKRPSTSINKFTKKFTFSLVHIIERWQNRTMILFCVSAIVLGVGIFFLSVDNRFIDYYKKSTEIYQGMEVIDQQFGGTTPLDIIIDSPQSFLKKTTHNSNLAHNSYWFRPEMLGKITAIHLYLESLPHTGKVLSIASTLAILETIDPKTTQDKDFMSLVYERFPQDIKKDLFNPFLSNNGNQLRFSIRVFESDYNLNRQDFLNQIRDNLITRFDLEPNQIKFTGMLVLYNNMLQSFFKSQIVTLGLVFICIFIMFIISFKNLKVAAIVLIPNMFAAIFVLGFMGWLGISLDLMTITIAAISIGIAVDDSIHYTHRLINEYRKNNNYWQAIKASHGTVGLAMIYTTIIITIGFSILAFSNFVPTVYFGLLTGCAMLVALITDLTLLPVLIYKFKPKM